MTGCFDLRGPKKLARFSSVPGILITIIMRDNHREKIEQITEETVFVLLSFLGFICAN